MRTREVRLFSIPDVVHIDPDIGPVSAGALSAAAIPREERGMLELAADVGMTKPDELTWWDWTVFLLHTAAEIEHALMVQYLYAAWSLADGGFPGPAPPPDAGAVVKGWQRTLVGIAKEEMAHLLTVQNLLRFVGGPLNLEREDFPFRAFLYPFPLRLEPLTRTSLAKYVAAEMPAPPPEPPEIIGEIVDRATDAAGGLPINRVGVLYDELTGIFADQARLADSQLRPETADTFQAGKNDWLGFGSLLVCAVRSRAEAVAALRAIGEQGEGSASPPAESPPSHFDRLLEIYTSFPETEGPFATVTWIPTRSVPSNPNTLYHPSTDAELERGRITHPTTRLWAHLFNVRYRMLLVDLAHALHLPGPLVVDGTPTARGRLRDWTFQEMRGRGQGGLRGIARILTRLPLKQAPDPTDPLNAGPPFELPYTLALPDDQRDRWRLHLALLDTSSELVAKLQAAGESQELLAELTAIDLAAKALVEAQLAS
jgi:Ferritin-like